MRPVRFVALSEDGQALVLADELGRLLGLPLDDRVQTAVHHDHSTSEPAAAPVERRVASQISLSPRDIQTRIRSGESADDIARSAGVTVDKVLRYAGPVLQERAMLAQGARRARLANSDRADRMSDVVDVKLAQHGVDVASVSWDAWRREDGTWRVSATWTSGKSTAQASWDMDRSRQTVTPHDEMAQFLSTPAPTSLRKDSDHHELRSPSTAARPSRDPLYGVTRRDPAPSPKPEPAPERPDPL
ncbi:MAG TPA: septation protein SepH, partial [Stackebrandtia sp.]|uniref:septation protein SepH n=1 Tax=Stackebrandtia sp. TaxID=2023065 RepID=UPI002D67B41B